MKKKIKIQKKWKWITGGGIICVCAVILFGKGMLRVKSSNVSDAGAVMSATVTTQTIETGVSGTGTLEYADSEAITVPESLQLDEVYVSAGSSVTQGTLLATVDAASLATCMEEVQEAIENVDDTITDEKDERVSTTISAGVAGRVKEIYAEAGESVTDVMKENGALALLSTDGYMAVDLAASDGVSVGTTLSVSDGETTIEGTVTEIVDETMTVCFSDATFDIGDTLSVTDSEDTSYGSAQAYVHAPLKVVGTSGTIKTIGVSEGSYVYASTNLITLKETSHTAQYQEAVKERESLVSLLNTLITIQADGGIVADEDGVVTNISEGNTTTSTSSSEQTQGSQNTLSRNETTTQEDAEVSVASTESTSAASTETTSVASAETTSAVTGGITTMSAVEVTSIQKTSDAQQTEDAQPAAPEGLVGTNGKITGTTGKMEYASDADAQEWKSCDDTATILPEGVWYVRYKATEEQAASAAVKVTVLAAEEQSTQATTQATSEQTTGQEKNTQTEKEEQTDSSQNEKQTGSASAKKSSDQTTVAAGSSSVAATGSSSSSGTKSTEDSSISTVDIITIAGGETMKVNMTVDELDILSMEVGLEANVTVDAIEDQTFSGTITNVSNATSGSSGVSQYTVEITFDKTTQMLEGMSASVEVILEKAENVLTLPILAVSDKGKDTVVYKTNNDGVLSDEVTIETGLSDDTNVEITSGLSEGDTVYYQVAGSEDGDSSKDNGGMPQGGMDGQMPGGGFDGKGEKPDDGGMPGGNAGNAGGKQ